MATEDDDVYHFIAYTPLNGRLYELDGLQPAPIDHGPCPSAAEFPDAVVPVLQRRISRYPPTEIRFNLLAMTRDLRIRAREIGDADALAREEKKREAWRWENALRKHNFVGFVGELMKGVAKAKLEEGDEAYEKWVKDAQERTKTRVAEAKKRGEAEAD
jgi:ubiquitin carboxyl-terminal hydrolase L5